MIRSGSVCFRWRHRSGLAARTVSAVLDGADADEGGSIELDAVSGTQGDHQVPASFLLVRRNARNNSARTTRGATPEWVNKVDTLSMRCGFPRAGRDRLAVDREIVVPHRLGGQALAHSPRRRRHRLEPLGRSHQIAHRRRDRPGVRLAPHGVLGADADGEPVVAVEDRAYLSRRPRRAPCPGCRSGGTRARTRPRRRVSCAIRSASSKWPRNRTLPWVILDACGPQRHPPLNRCPRCAVRHRPGRAARRRPGSRRPASRGRAGRS